MPNKISAASKSFLILFLIALLGSLFCLNLWLRETSPDIQNLSYQSPWGKQDSISSNQSPSNINVDTSSWKTYTDPNYHFSFSYSPDWKVLPAKNQNGYQVIQIDPGKKYYDFKIYISPSDYYALAGVEATSQTVAGKTAIDADGLLFGLQNGGYYYTFDIGESLSLKPQFDAMVMSVKFSN